MECPDYSTVLLQSFRPRTQSMRFNTGVNSDQQVQQDDSKPDTQYEFNLGTPEPKNGPPLAARIEFRIQQLNNRRFLLLKMQRFRKKAEDNSGGTTEEMTCEDSDKLCELEAIRKELEELMVQRNELGKQGKHTKLSKHPPTNKIETPRGGIYLLPSSQLMQEDMTLEQRVKTRPTAGGPTEPVVPVDSLSRTPAVVHCPSCQEVVLTETRSRMGEATWMLCCLCSMTGCIAGCCLIPFFTNRLKDVHHQCTQCQAHIHTYQPF